MSTLTDDKAYALETRLNALMGRVGLVDSGSNPQVVSGAGWTGNIGGSKLAGVRTISGLATTVLTSAGFTSVPGGDVEAGTTYQIHASGSFSTGSGTAPSGITFSVFWGGIAGANIASASPPGAIGTSISGAGWYIDAEVNFLSTTEAEVTLRVGWHTAAGIGNEVSVFSIADTTGLSTGGSQNLSLGIQWGSAPTGTSLNCDACRLGRVA